MELLLPAFENRRLDVRSAATEVRAGVSYVA